MPKKILETGIGKRIATKRRFLGLSGRDLADRIGVSAATLSQWESGVANPSAAHVLILARTLEESTDFLLASPEMAAEVETLVAKLSERLSPESLNRIQSFGDENFDQLAQLLEMVLKLPE